MCGIAGIYKPGGIGLNEVNSLSKTLEHRGPDDEGFFLMAKGEKGEIYRGDDTIQELNQLPHISSRTNKSSLALVHRRLSILDTSSLGHQPYISKDRRFILVFNGEVYNFKEIRIELEKKGYAFVSNSDTEVVLNAFIEWGENCVNQFVGMWALALYDQLKGTLTLSRDRYGIKPLYYYKDDERFVFASEIKAILTIEGIDRSISEEDLASYLAYGTTERPYKNLFKKIYDIEPGCNYNFDLSSFELKSTKYYHVNLHGENNTDNIETNTRRFEELFNASVSLHLRSDVEVGSCLSGGLDSSAIVYSSSKQLKGVKLKTFTAAYENKTVDESDYARMVTAPLKNVEDYYTYPDARTLVKDIDKLIYYQDLPIGSTSMFAQWEVMKCVNKNRVKVLLDGQGSDEVLGGYYNFAGIHLIELLKEMKFRRFFSEYKLLKKNFTPNIRNAVLRAAYYYLPTGLQHKLRKTERLSYGFINPDRLKDLDLSIPKRGGKTFIKHAEMSVYYGLYDLLRYEDRNSMAFSIESRVPFLDHRLVEFVMGLPNQQKIFGGWTKYILRKSIDNKLDDRVVWRKDKKGFVTPQQDWKNELMKTLVTELKESNMPSLMNRSYVLSLCDSDFSNSSHLSEFWRAYTVVKWYNRFDLRG